MQLSDVDMDGLLNELPEDYRGYHNSVLVTAFALAKNDEELLEEAVEYMLDAKLTPEATWELDNPLMVAAIERLRRANSGDEPLRPAAENLFQVIRETVGTRLN